MLAGPGVIDADGELLRGERGIPRPPAARCAASRRRRPVAIAADGSPPRCASRRPDAGFGGSLNVPLDLRVDDHPRPIDELARLLALYEEHDGPDPGGGAAAARDGAARGAAGPARTRGARCCPRASRA